MELDQLRRALQDSPVSEIRAFDEIGSTNDEALRWLDEGAPDMALVIADRQTRGRGRFDRLWVTEPGASLAFTVILRQKDSSSDPSVALYAPLGGLAVWQTLHDFLDIPAQIKWPNDVLIARRKCCGILAEAAWTGSRVNGVVVGIGINITKEALPPETSALFPATWVEKHTSRIIDRFSLLADILNNLEKWRPKLGSREFFEEWQQNLAFLGEEVRIEQAGGPILAGREQGIDTDGNLLLINERGATIKVQVGDVHLRSEV